MATITPFDTTALSRSTLATCVVDWQIHDAPDHIEILHTAHSIHETQVPLLCSSFVELEHEGGKIWNSLFVPVSLNGNEGFSVTWWGKDRFVRGQMQIKSIGESEWYNLVKSKVAKDYGVCKYVGRFVPLNTNHSFINAIKCNQKLPMMAFDTGTVQDVITSKTAVGLGSAMAKALKNIVPVEHFLKGLTDKGYDLDVEMEGSLSIWKTGSSQVSDIIEGVKLTGLAESASDRTTITIKGRSSTKAPQPVIDREAAYGGGWGGFA
jgi:hypothetical protein